MSNELPEDGRVSATPAGKTTPETARGGCFGDTT